jgi:tetratricopeptide (TPR) repeat protein
MIQFIVNYRFIYFVGTFFLLISCSNQEDPTVILDFKKGVKLIEQEEYDKAIAFLNNLSRQKIEDKTKAALYRNLSISYQMLGKIDSAKYYMNKAVSLAESDSFEYFFYKGEQAVLSNDFNSALKNFKKAEQLNESHAELFNSMCSLYSGDYSDVFFDPNLAEKYALKAYKLNPTKFSQEQLASVYFQNENYIKSESLFRKLQVKFPENQKYKFNLGQAMYFSGKENKGLELMKEAADRDDSCKVLFFEIFENK